MRAVVTRVTEASVSIEGRVTARIGPGLLVLLGVGIEDALEDSTTLARKVAHLRVFPDGHRPLNRSVEDVGGSVLVVSQFTLLADTRKGRRPSFVRSAGPETAVPLYEAFVRELRDLFLPVETGEFGASMQVASVNDGPVTIVLTTRAGDSI